MVTVELPVDVRLEDREDVAEVLSVLVPDEVAVELTLVDTLDVAEDVTDEVSVLVWVDVPLLLCVLVCVVEGDVSSQFKKLPSTCRLTSSFKAFASCTIVPPAAPDPDPSAFTNTTW